MDKLLRSNEVEGQLGVTFGKLLAFIGEAWRAYAILFKVPLLWMKESFLFAMRDNLF